MSKRQRKRKNHKIVAEATYKITKTEFVNRRHLDSLEELLREFEYVHWYN